MREVPMYWKVIIRIGALILLLNFIDGCSSKSEGIKGCQNCPKGYYCDLNKKRCLPKSCFSCKSDAECENDEICSGGCCIPKDQGVLEPSSDEGMTLDSEGAISDGEFSSDLDAGFPEEFARESSPCPGGNCTESVSEQSCPDCGPAEGKKDCFQSPCPSGLCCSSSGSCKPCGKKVRCSSCSDHPECGPTQRCVSVQGGGKICLPSCEGNSGTCPTGFFCFTSGQNYGKVCIPSGTCQPPDLCKGVSCPSGQKCCPKDGKCRYCCDKSDCPTGQICELSSGQCKPDPNACSPPCKAGELCNVQKGVCEKDCRKFGCPSTSICDKVTGFCVAKDCRSNWTCPSGQVCDQATGKCKRETCVQRPSLCSPPSCCNRSTGTCTTDCLICGCPSGYTCDSGTRRCKQSVCKAKSTCKTSRDCCGRFCLFGNCPCKKGSDCASGICLPILNTCL